MCYENLDLIDPIREADEEDLSRMHMYEGVDEARNEFRQMQSAGQKPVAFHVPKEHYAQSFPADRWEILDESEHADRISYIRLHSRKIEV